MFDKLKKQMSSGYDTIKEQLSQENGFSFGEPEKEREEYAVSEYKVEETPMKSDGESLSTMKKKLAVDLLQDLERLLKIQDSEENVYLMLQIIRKIYVTKITLPKEVTVFTSNSERDALHTNELILPWRIISTHNEVVGFSFEEYKRVIRNINVIDVFGTDESTDEITKKSEARFFQEDQE